MAINTRKKNAFVSKGLASVKRDFRAKIESNISALRANDVEAADLVRVHPKSGEYEFTIGEGANNWYVSNTEIEQGEVAFSDDLTEIADFYEDTVLVAFESGDLDAGLKVNFEKRKAAGSKMMGKLKEKFASENEMRMPIAANG